MRMPEMIDLFTPYFWLWEIEINSLAPLDYVTEIRRRLPADSPYRAWPPQLLQTTGGRVWFVRKENDKEAAN